MNTSDFEFVRIPYIVKFNTLYELKEDIPLVLNELQIYTMNEDFVGQEVDFTIFTCPDGKRYISPQYNPAHCDGFLLRCERLYKPDKSYSSLLDWGNINVSPTFTAENSKFNLEYLE